MTGKFNGAVTAKGASLITEAIANNTKMTFLKIIGSTTKYTDDQLPLLDDSAITSASHNQDGHISNVTIKDQTTIATELVLDGNSVEADYQLNSVLILATVDGTDHLFGVLGANQPQFMNAYDGKSATNLEIQCSFKVANTDHVDITVNSAGTLTAADYVRLQSYAASQATSAQTSAYSHADSAVAAEAVKRSNAVSSAISAETKALASEAAIRSTADSAESVTRSQADSAENLARISADKSLATAVSAEAATRSGAAATAMSAIASEASARAAANSGEATTRSTADKSLAAAVSAEAGTRSTAVAASKSAESSLVAAVSAEASTRASASNNEANIRSAADSAEVATRLAADNSLATKIAGEASARNASMVAETNARSTADRSISQAASAVSVNLSAETVARSTADATEKSARTAADSSEASARSQADASLTTKVTAAQTAANNANTNANGRLPDYKLIPASADLNTYQTVGFFGNSSDAQVQTMKNAPTTHAFSMIVNIAAGATQFLCEYMTTGARMWHRSYYDGTWGAWHEVVQADLATTLSGKMSFTQAPRTVAALDSKLHGILEFDLGHGLKIPLYGVTGGDTNGDGVALGAGGLTVVGAGESATTYMNDVINDTLPTSLTKLNSVGDERAVIASDGPVHLVSNLQNNDANAKEAVFDASGNLTIPGAFHGSSGAFTNASATSLSVNNPIAITKDLSAVNSFTKLIYANTVTDSGYVAVGNEGTDKGYLELGTTDDAITAIYVRKRTSADAINTTATLLDNNNNTNFPGTINQAGRPVATQEYVKGTVDKIDDTIGNAIGSPTDFVNLGINKVYRQKRTLTATGIGTSTNYGFLITEVAAAVKGGVFQSFKYGADGRPQVYMRTSMSATTWGSWELVTTW